MRAYVAIVPADLQNFLDEGFLFVTDAFVPEVNETSDLMDETELEELEFAASWEAASLSREMQGDGASAGLALALEVESDQQSQSGRIHLESQVSFEQVQALLVSDSEEPELSWFAPQEIATYLPEWLA